MRARKLSPLLLVVPALAMAACGGTSDKDKITDIIIDGGKDPVTICDHLAEDTMKALGGVEECQKAAKEAENQDPDVKVQSIDIQDDKATAKIHGNQGDQTITFAKDGDDWKVTASE